VDIAAFALSLKAAALQTLAAAGASMEVTATCSDTAPVATPGASSVNGSEQATAGGRRLLQAPTTTIIKPPTLPEDLENLHFGLGGQVGRADGHNVADIRKES
jgi:hypothetical protein